MSFRDELRQKVRTKEEIEQQKMEAELKQITIVRQNAQAAAERTLQLLQKTLLENVNQADYVSDENQQTITAILRIAPKYLHSFTDNNATQYRENQEKLFFKDRSMSYKSWTYYTVQPEYNEEFQAYKEALVQLATKDKIRVEFVLENKRRNLVFPFPNVIEYEQCFDQCFLAVKATCTYVVDPETQELELQEVDILTPDEPLQEETPPTSSFSKGQKRSLIAVLAFLLIGWLSADFIVENDLLPWYALIGGVLIIILTIALVKKE